MAEFPYLYRGSFEEAKQSGKLDKWYSSHQENIACRNDIETAIAGGFDGEHLAEDRVQDVLDRHGFLRVQYVLANTIHERHCASQIDEGPLQWSQQMYVPRDTKYSPQFVVQGPPAALNLFAGQLHRAYQALELFGPEHCVEESKGLDYTGKVLVLRPDVMKESCWSPQSSLWEAHAGFGCSPTAVGRAVYATCLGDGEQARWDRGDFIGVLKDEFLPDWAREKLEELHAPKQEGPSMGGMS